jgi:hypothetical protein
MEVALTWAWGKAAFDGSALWAEGSSCAAGLTGAGAAAAVIATLAGGRASGLAMN